MSFSPLKHVAPLIVASTLTACASPSPEFRHRDTRKHDITIEGARFKIHQREDWVESYRVNFEAAPKVSSVMRRAKIAIEMATGCPIREGSLTGDQGIQRAQLDCDGTLPPVPKPVRVDLDCEIQDGWHHDDNRVVMENVECTPIAARQ